MSEYRINKDRVGATLTLSDGRTVRGSFFVAGSSRLHTPERVKDVLNGGPAFFPFEVHSPSGLHTGLFNRDQVLLVALTNDEAHADAAYEVAKRAAISILLANGTRLSGTVSLYCPQGRDRLSDYTRADETFRYLETGSALLLVNFRYVLELSELEAA